MVLVHLMMVLVQIILRTINSSKSAYAAVTYYAAFFHSYDLLGTAVVQAGILMKVISLRATHL